MPEETDAADDDVLNGADDTLDETLTAEGDVGGELSALKAELTDMKMIAANIDAKRTGDVKLFDVKLIDANLVLKVIWALPGFDVGRPIYERVLSHGHPVHTEKSQAAGQPVCLIPTTCFGWDIRQLRAALGSGHAGIIRCWCW